MSVRPGIELATPASRVRWTVTGLKTPLIGPNRRAERQ